MSSCGGSFLFNVWSADAGSDKRSLVGGGTEVRVDIEVVLRAKAEKVEPSY